MALKDLAVSVALKLRDELSKGLDKAGEKVRDFGRATDQAGRSAGPLGRAYDGLKTRVKGLGESFTAARVAAVGFVSYLTGRMVGALTGLTDQWGQLSAQIKLVTETEAEAVTVRQQLLELSNRTRTDLQANVQLYASLARSTEQLGLSQGDLLGITETISQAMKVSGASAAEAAGSLRQLAQALASGTLRGDEFNSMNEQAPRLMQALADQLGITRGELRAMAEAGELTSERLVAAFQGQGDRIAAEFAVLPKTFAGVFQKIRNDILGFVGSTDEATGASARAVEMIGSGWESIKTSITENADGIIAALRGIGAALDVLLVRPVKVGFNLVTIAARTTTAALFSLIWAFQKLLATFTFGETSRQFKRDAQAMAETINQLGRDVATDFADIGDAISPAEDAVKKTGDAAGQAAEQVKALADQAGEGVNVKAGVTVDEAAVRAELSRLQQIADANPVTVRVQTITTGTGADDIQREVLKRGDL